MKVAIVYVYPAHCCDRYDDYTYRFLQSYSNFKPKADHESIVMVCGGEANTETKCMFGCLKGLHVIKYNNEGWDIGAFQWAARNFQADLMVFFGTTAWIKGNGWLDRMIQSFEKHGDHLFGTMGNRGNSIVGVHPHIRTTGFWLTPKLMNSCPFRVTHPAHRYPFEHGPNCLTKHAWNMGRKALVVTWNGEYEWAQWDMIPNGYHQGNQSALIVGDRNSDPPFHPIG